MPTPYIRNPYRQSTRSWYQEQIMTVDNFAGGLNNVEPDTVIADNESTDCRNMRFIGNTLMEKRPGTALYCETLPTLSGSITWVDRYAPQLGDGKIVQATNSELYIGGKKLCDVEGQVHGVTYNGMYYFVDGKHLWVYDGNNVYRVIKAPIAHITEKVSTTVIVVDNVPEQTKTGDKVYITAGALGQETNYVSTIKSISGKNITLSDSLSGTPVTLAPVLFYDPGSEKATEGSEVWNTDNGVAYYQPCLNELADSYAGEPYIPDSPNVIVVHKNRIFIAGDNTQPHAIYCSTFSPEAPLPLYFPSGIYLQVKPDGKPIVDLVVFDDALIIGRNNDIYVLYGSSEYLDLSDDPFYIKQMDSTVGFMNTDCGALLNNYYIYLGYDGRFYKLNTPTTYVEYLMTRPLPWKCDIYSDPFDIEQNSIVKTSTVAYRNEIYFNINEDLTVIYNYDNQAFTYYTGWKSSALHSLGISLLVGRTDGVLSVYKDDVEIYLDMNEPIDACYFTKRFDLGNSANYKYFKSFMLSTHAYDDFTSDVSVSVEIDYYEKTVDTIANSNISRFGTAVWGRDRFNNKNLYKTPYINLDVRGRTIKYIFKNDKVDENGVGEPFRIYDINTLWSIRDVR